MKKTVLHVAISGLLGFIALACTQQAQPRVDSMSHVKSEQSALASQKSHQRSLEDAKSIALEFLRNQQGKGRSLSAVTFSTSVWLRNSIPSLRSIDNEKRELVDTILYVLNLSATKSCLLISGDDRLPSVIGYLPNDTLNLNKIPKESGISLFMSSFPGYYGNYDPDRAPGNGRRPGPQPDSRADYEPEFDQPWSRCIGERKKMEVSPICPVQWGQWFPYNAKAPVFGNENALAGCVAVAAAQLMASYHPSVSLPSGVRLDWTMLTKHPQWMPMYLSEPDHIRSSYVEQVSSLLRVIGDRLKNRWGVGDHGTGALSEDIPKVLYSLDQSVICGKPMSYNDQKIRQYLDRGFPVIMSGGRAHGAGHAWLCDGYLSLIVEYEYGLYRRKHRFDVPDKVVSGTYTDHQFLFHYNWGWNGQKDGFFAAGVFDADPSLKDGRLNFSQRVKYIPVEKLF